MSKNIGLALTDEGWAIAEISGGKAGKITQLLSGKWSPENSVLTKATILQEAFQNYRLPKEKVVVSAPLKAGYWKELIVPALSARDIEPLIKNTFFASIPQPLAPRYWGYQKHQFGGQQLRVACFALPEQVGSGLENLLERAEINPAYFLPDLYGLSKGLNSLVGPSHHREEPALFVLVNRLSVEVALVHGEEMVYYRCFPLLLNNGMIESRALEEDLRLTKFMLRKESPDRPNICYLWDQTGQLSSAEWQAVLSSAFTLEAKQVQTFSALGLPAQFYAGNGNAETMLTRIMAVGLAVEAGEKKPAGLRLYFGGNLRRKGEKQRAFRLLIFGLIMALASVGLNAWLMQRERATLITNLVQKEAKVEKIKNLVTTAEQFNDQATFYRQEWEKTRQMLEFFSLWAEIAPEGTILTSVILEKEQITQLSGRCLSFSKLYAALLDSPYFRQLQLKGEITINRDGYECFTLAGHWYEQNEAKH